LHCNKYSSICLAVRCNVGRCVDRAGHARLPRPQQENPYAAPPTARARHGTARHARRAPAVMGPTLRRHTEAQGRCSELSGGVRQRTPILQPRSGRARLRFPDAEGIPARARSAAVCLPPGWRLGAARTAAPGGRGPGDDRVVYSVVHPVLPRGLWVVAGWRRDAGVECCARPAPTPSVAVWVTWGRVAWDGWDGVGHGHGHASRAHTSHPVRSRRRRGLASPLAARMLLRRPVRFHWRIDQSIGVGGGLDASTSLCREFAGRRRNEDEGEFAESHLLVASRPRIRRLCLQMATQLHVGCH
jgi:hypothetical protein